MALDKIYIVIFYFIQNSLAINKLIVKYITKKLKYKKNLSI